MTTSTDTTAQAASVIAPIGYIDGKPYYYTDGTCISCGAAYGYGCC